MTLPSTPSPGLRPNSPAVVAELKMPAHVDVIVAPGLLVVQDDGPGVPPALLPTLVRRFERGPGAAEGSGLGLAIVDAIARQSGARLVLHSPVAQGRGFRAELRF